MLTTNIHDLSTVDLLDATGVISSVTPVNGSFILRNQFSGPTNAAPWSNISALFSMQFGFFTQTILGTSQRNVFRITGTEGDQFSVSITNAMQLQVNLPGVVPQFFNIPTDNRFHRLGISLRNGRELVVYIDCLSEQLVTLPNSVGPLIVGGTIMAVVGGNATVSALRSHGVQHSTYSYFNALTSEVIFFSLRSIGCCWTQAPLVD